MEAVEVDGGAGRWGGGVVVEGFIYRKYEIPEKCIWLLSLKIHLL